MKHTQTLSQCPANQPGKAFRCAVAFCLSIVLLGSLTEYAQARPLRFDAPGSSVRGKVFLDRSHNGRQEAGESGMADITIQLLAKDSTLVAEQKSSANGMYAFDELDYRGEYFLRFSKPSGYSFSPKDSDSDESSDSDVDPYSGETDAFTVTHGGGVVELDAGLFEEPAAVWISDFRADRKVDGHVWLLWETGTEVDVMGFNIYRSRTPKKGQETVNFETIFPAFPGSVIGAVYGYEDSRAQNDQDYYYWLEVLRGSGPRLYGPVFVSRVPRNLFLPVVRKP